MSLWFLLWFLLSFILLGATFWSTIILIQQKQAWKEYAKKYGLTYTSGKFFAPPNMEGVIDGYNVSFFTAVQQNPDARKNRQLTVMQVNANTPFVDGIACGTAEMLPFLQSLELLTPHEVKEGTWNKKNHIRTRHKKAVDAFLTAERVHILNEILSMPNADIIVILDDSEGIFRFETPNPLNDAKKIDVVLHKLMTRIKKLEPSDTEEKSLETIVKQEGVSQEQSAATTSAAEPTPPVVEEPVAEPETASETEEKEKPETKAEPDIATEEASSEKEATQDEEKKS